MKTDCVISCKNIALGEKARSFIQRQADRLGDVHPNIDYAELRLWKVAGQFYGMLRAPIPGQSTVTVQSRSGSLGHALHSLFERGVRKAKRKRERQIQH